MEQSARKTGRAQQNGPNFPQILPHFQAGLFQKEEQ